jgi:hypothetical protein
MVDHSFSRVQMFMAILTSERWWHSVRQEIHELVKLGPLPDEQANVERIAEYERLLLSISRPVTDEEAKALVGLFGPDDSYGLAWTLLHLIETAPGWPIEECLQNDANQWIHRLRIGMENMRKRDGK